MRHLRFPHVLFVVVCAVHLTALYLPSTPEAGPVEEIPYADKVVHVVLFAVVALAGRWAGITARPLLAVLVVDAVASELIQGSLLPERTADATDFLADLAGIALGLLVARWVGLSGADTTS